MLEVYCELASINRAAGGRVPILMGGSLITLIIIYIRPADIRFGLFTLFNIRE